MKKRIIYVAILSAMICATILSGCNNTEVTSNDTEPVTTTSAVITTVAPTTKATETTVAPTTESETTVAQTEAETEPQDTEAQTEAPKVETEKPETNKPSSNTNSGGNTTSSQKPAQNNNNNNTSNNNKPNDNTTQVVTDDTPIPHSQLCTDANMSKITSAVNTYFINLGMTHNPSLNKDNSGWFLTQTNLVAYSECSVNNFMNDTIVSFNNEADAFGSMYGVTYSDWTFNCYAEKQANGEYNIYFCHE